MIQSLYIHFPFCQKKCHYCSFFSVESHTELYAAYVEALGKEFLSKSRDIGRHVHTVYFGGGTPSLIPIHQMETLFSLINRVLIDNKPEITLEVNPGTISPAQIDDIVRLGVNRVSVGVQSFRDHELRVLGRIHSSRQAIACIEAFSQAGLDNISIDLMFGLPGQTVTDLLDSLKMACSLPIKHLSLYGLSVDPGTVFANEVQQGCLVLPEEDVYLRMYEKSTDYLSGQGFYHYEISNYARLGYESAHNLHYWNYDDFIGLGAGATSMFDSIRYTTDVDIPLYLNNPVVCNRDVESLSVRTQLSEMMFMGLRRMRGVDLGSVGSRLGLDVELLLGAQIQQLCSMGLLQRHGQLLALSAKGVMLSNEVFSRLL